MFKSLKDKIKNAVSSLTKKSEQETQEESVSENKKEDKQKNVTQPKKETTKEQVEKKSEKKGAPAKSEKPAKKELTEKPKPVTQDIDSSEEKAVEEKKEEKGFFTRLSEKITTVDLSEEKFEELFWDLEIGLLENNVAVEVIEKIKEELKEELTTGRTARGKLQERIYRRLETTLREILSTAAFDLLEDTKDHQPLIIAAIGVNGSGKTTTLAKLAHYFTEHDKTVILAAADTFRAAAIQQLQEHANNLDIPIIKQDYGSDAAAVAYDAINAAKARNIDVVLIDTAGRLHSNKNLMDELQKLIRVANPHRTIFIGESTTGNDCVQQAKQFSEHIKVDGIILTKADVDESGGAAISASYVTNTPILFLGTGQEYSDLTAFSPDIILKQVLSQD